MKTTRTILVLLCISVFMFTGTVPEADAQGKFPEKPITLIVTFPAGGPAEISAKALAEASAKYLSQPITIKIVAGAGGSAGTTEIVQAAPDGYTLGVTAAGALTTQPHLLKLPYASPADYTPIINLIDNPPLSVGPKRFRPHWR